VQLGNVAEFYITFFALLQIGVAPVNALFSHQRSELNAYAAQIKPALLIADREHALFADDEFLNAFVDAPLGARVLLRGDRASTPWRRRLRARRIIYRQPDACRRSGLFPAFRRQYRHAEADPAPITTTTTAFAAATRSAALPRNPLPERAARGAQLRHELAGIARRLTAGGCVVLANDPSATLCFPLIEQHQINVTSLVPPAVSLWLQAIAEGAATRSCNR
jgi:2,3-dihydroxybenzoate-AMP ligase